jgi:hypothetical protein
MSGYRLVEDFSAAIQRGSPTCELGSERVLYKRKFCSLREAVMLIADHLADADRERYADPVAALRDARAQLLQALFEGAVRSEGVSYEVGPQEYGPPSIEYDRWIPIDRGTWLHEKCEESDHIYHIDSVEVCWDRDAGSAASSCIGLWLKRRSSCLSPSLGAYGLQDAPRVLVSRTRRPETASRRARV